MSRFFEKLPLNYDFRGKLLRSLNSDESEDPNATDDFIFQVTGFIIQMVIILFFFWEGVSCQQSISGESTPLACAEGTCSKFLLWMHRINKTKD